MPGKKHTFLKYSEQQMTAAMNEVQRGMPISTAAKKHKVPRVTLLYKVRGKTPVQRKMGRDCYLLKGEEKLLVSWILKMARAGFPIQKQQLIESVQRLMIELKRDNPFKDNKPGNSWYASFLKRNPEISIRNKIQENQRKERAEERRLKKIEREKMNAEKKAARERKKKQKQVSHSDSETCEDEEWVESGDSVDDISFQETMDVTDSDDENKLQFKESDYVLVSFPGKKKVHRYVCVIQTIFPNDEPEVVEMKQFENDKKVFRLNDNDVSIISLDQILEKLNFPKISAAGDRLKYEFDKDIEVDG
ncbi:uncharacterized protein [Leptinotarsa decemlineata]|uniref:uncharacterized protein n=1 Tax=Leptinotarsa decemlineata TaxID=7539 RepID=UPI003D30A7D6